MALIIEGQPAAVNQITSRSAFNAITVPPMPRLSEWMTVCIRHATAAVSLPPLVIPARAAVAVAEEAAAILPVLQRRARPAQLDEWRDFLLPLVAAVRNPPAKDDFGAFVTAVAVALDDVPAHLLSGARRKSLVLAFDFWPSVKDVAGWLAPAWRAERALLAEVARLATNAPSPAPSAQEERTAEAIAAVAGKVRAFAAEMRGLEKAPR